MNLDSTAKEIIEYLENRIEKNLVKDSVHKVKFMTARDMIVEITKDWLIHLFKNTEIKILNSVKWSDMVYIQVVY